MCTLGYINFLGYLGFPLSSKYKDIMAITRRLCPLFEIGQMLCVLGTPLTSNSLSSTEMEHISMLHSGENRDTGHQAFANSLHKTIPIVIEIPLHPILHRIINLLLTHRRRIDIMSYGKHTPPNSESEISKIAHHKQQQQKNRKKQRAKD
jgi:hypothetical protein